MKKIMFNDEFVLTQAVLDGRKTMTRRLVGDRMTEADIVAYLRGHPEVAFENAPFKIGEEVAIAQSYYRNGMPSTECINGLYRRWCDEPGWTNKMFVKPNLMRHRIRIKNIRVERLQDISDADCLKEGIKRKNEKYLIENERGVCFYTNSPTLAFRFLIDRICGKGTWSSNPWVYAYSFELVK